MTTPARMRSFFDTRDPFAIPATTSPFRVLFVESGSRSLSEGLIGHFRELWQGVPIDLVTCYAGLPDGFADDTVVFRVGDYITPESRRDLFAQLRNSGYTAVVMICSAEPIMTKWKAMIAARVPGKLLIVNENGDYFWFHRDNLTTIRQFILVRAGLSGAGALRTFGRLLLFPFSVLFLLLYAFTVHLRRRVRILLKPDSFA